MNRAAAARGIFDAYAIVQITLRDVIAELSGYAAAFEAFQECVETAHVDRGFAAGEGRAGFSVNVDDAGFAKSELRGQRAGHEGDVIGEARRQFWPKAGNTFRQEHVVDAVLQIGVFAADVQLPE